MKKLLIAALIAAPALGFASSINLIANGSFEADAQGISSWHIYSDLSSWTGGANGIELRNAVSGTAKDGVNFVELDTTANSTMSQGFTTVVGKTYDLSFWVAQRPDYGYIGSTGLSWSVGGAAFNVAQNGNTDWTEVTGSFTATSTLTTLSFAAIGDSNRYGTSIDKVSVTAAVPEPETYALMLAGLGAIGFVARRRQPR